MKRKLFVIPLTFAAATLFSSCATILSGTKQKISVNSTGKTGVTFQLDNKTYKTPAIITVKRENEDKVIKVLDEDCSQKQVLLNKKINPVFFVNLLSGGVFGSTTDYISNAMWRYDDNVQIQCK